MAGAAMTNGVPFSASIELSSPALTVPARKSYRFSVQTVHRCFHTDPVLPLGGILTCVPSPIRHSNSGAHNLAAQRREVSHITASQLTFLSEPAETILPQPSTSYQSESAPESTRVPARTARRRARKKEAAINPQADLAAGNQLTDPVEWAGLATWRAEEVDESRGLGKEGPEAGVQLRLEEGETHEFVLADTLAECGRQVSGMLYFSSLICPWKAWGMGEHEKERFGV